MIKTEPLRIAQTCDAFKVIQSTIAPGVVRLASMLQHYHSIVYDYPCYPALVLAIPNIRKRLRHHLLKCRPVRIPLPGGLCRQYIIHSLIDYI
jgi:hypothetical protein